MAKKTYRVRTNNNEGNTFSTSNKRWLNQTKFSIISVVTALIIGISTIYITYQNNISDKKNFTNIGTLEIRYKNSISNLELIDSYPTSDELGLKKKPYTFTITNKGNYDVSYKVRLIDNYSKIVKENCQNKLLSNTKVKVSVDGKRPFILGNIKNNNYIIAEDILSKNKHKEYKIRIWITDDAKEGVLNKHYHGKIVVDTVSVNTK